MAKIHKGDRLRYAGPYALGVQAAAKYPPGTVVGFRQNGNIVTVRLDGEPDHYADWPTSLVAPADS